MNETELVTSAAEPLNRAPILAAPVSGPVHADDGAPATGTNVCVVGGGFVGLVTAAGLAQTGHTVTCVEKDAQKAEELASGHVALYVRGLPELVQANLRRGRLSFSTDLADSLGHQDFVVVAVGTPTGGDGRSDMTAFDEVVTALDSRLHPGQVIVIKSTVPVGTARRVQMHLNRHDGAQGVAVVSSPEFLREGTAVYDFFHPQRIVVGGTSPVAVEQVVQLYRVGLAHPAPIVTTSNEAAELIKYASNVYLAMRISFVNEMSAVCDALEIEIADVVYAMGLDRRIGSEYLNVGPGYGGSCLPKDVDAFIAMAAALGVDLAIAPAVRTANQRQLDRVVAKLRVLLDGNLQGRQIGVLGLSFKAQTHDMRSSPAVAVIRKLLAAGATVRAYDPAAMNEAARQLPQIELVRTAEGVAVDADAIMILTEWPEFQLLDWPLLRSQMRRPNLVDARNLLTPETMCNYGFNYVGMGRTRLLPALPNAGE